MANETTIVVVPRERFSFAIESLDKLLERTSSYHALVYVDGGSPPHVRDVLRERANRYGFTLLRTDSYLSPNEARNLALPHVHSRYVLFADNDILVAPQWASRLQACADETGAWMVAPLYCERLPEQSQIHMAGGEAEIRMLNGRRTLYEQHFWPHRPLAEAQGKLFRCETGLTEFHAVLVRMDAFDVLGPLDERLLSAAEHVDLCLCVRNAGGKIYFEPDSVITYVPPSRMDTCDLDYFYLRWCRAWCEVTIERLREKWDLPHDDPGLVAIRHWQDDHRHLGIPWLQNMRRRLGRRIHKRILRYAVAPIEPLFNLRRYPQLQANTRCRPVASIIHAGSAITQEAA